MLSFASKAYFPPPGAYEEYRANLQKWYESLDDDAKKALKTYRRRKRGSGFGLYGFSYFLLIYPSFLTIVSTYRFISEAWKSSQAGSIGERISELSKVYKSFSDEKRAVCYLFSGWGDIHFNLTMFLVVCVGVYETRPRNFVWRQGRKSSKTRKGIGAGSSGEDKAEGKIKGSEGS